MLLSEWFDSANHTTCSTCGEESPMLEELIVEQDLDEYVRTVTLDRTCELCGGGSVESVTFAMC